MKVAQRRKPIHWPDYLDPGMILNALNPPTKSSRNKFRARFKKGNYTLEDKHAYKNHLRAVLKVLCEKMQGRDASFFFDENVQYKVMTRLIWKDTSYENGRRLLHEYRNKEEAKEPISKEMVGRVKNAYAILYERLWNYINELP